MPCNWAAGVQKQYASLGMAAGRIHNIHCLSFCKAVLAWDMSVWDGLHYSLRGAPKVPSFAPICGSLQALEP